MRRFLFLAVVLAVAVPGLSAQDADQIVARGLKAIGGAEKLKSVQSRRVTGRMTAGGGAAEGPFTLTQKRPDRFYFEAELLNSQFIQAYDGSEAWQLQPAVAGGSGEREPMPEKQAQGVIRQAAFDTPLIDYRKKGIQIELAGKETVDGRSAYHLKLTRKDGSMIDYYLDSETYLLIKTVSLQYNPQTGAESEFEIWYKDYREVGGVKLPYSLETRSGGVALSSRTVEKVEFNIEVDNQLFQRNP